MRSTSRRSVSIRLETYERLRIFAASFGSSMSNVVERLLSPEGLEALAAPEAGKNTGSPRCSAGHGKIPLPSGGG